jgi:Lipocalin-like domain
MKKTAYLWLILLSFAVVACGGAKGKLVGLWVVESVSGKAPKTERTIEFKKDGTFAQSVKKASGNSSDTRTGKWELSKDEKTISLTPDGEKTATIEIVKLDAKEFEFKDERNTIKLKKK